MKPQESNWRLQMGPQLLVIDLVLVMFRLNESGPCWWLWPFWVKIHCFEFYPTPYLFEVLVCWVVFIWGMKIEQSQITRYMKGCKEANYNSVSIIFANHFLEGIIEKVVFSWWLKLRRIHSSLVRCDGFQFNRRKQLHSSAMFHHSSTWSFRHPFVPGFARSSE